MEKYIDGNLDLNTQTRLVNQLEVAFWDVMSLTQAPSSSDTNMVNRVTLIRRDIAANAPAPLSLAVLAAGQSVAQLVNDNAGKVLVFCGKAYVLSQLQDVYGFRG